MRFIQSLICLLHGLIIWRCFYIIWSLANELREGANGIRVSLLLLFSSLVSRSAWGLVTAFHLNLSRSLLFWRLGGGLLTWLSLVLLERKLRNGDKTAG